MRGASRVSSGRPNCHIPEGILPAAASSFRSWPRDGASPSGAALVVQPFAAAVDSGRFLRLTRRSAGRFQFWRGQNRRSDGRRQRCDVFPAWRQLHVGDDRSGQGLKRGQPGIGNAQGLKQSTRPTAKHVATAQYRRRWMPSPAPTPLSCCRYAPGMEGERRLTAFVPQSFARVPTLRGWRAEKIRGRLHKRRPPLPATSVVKKRIDSTCSGALPACRWSQGRPPASRSWRCDHI